MWTFHPLETLAQDVRYALLATSPVTFPSFVTPGINAPVALFTVGVSLACGTRPRIRTSTSRSPTAIRRSRSSSAPTSSLRRSSRRCAR
jgi:hypothetical protein